MTRAALKTRVLHCAPLSNFLALTLGLLPVPSLVRLASPRFGGYILVVPIPQPSNVPFLIS